jgi:hypothetical protein
MLRPSGSFRGRVASPATLLGGDARLSASTDTKNANHRCSDGEHKQEAAEQFHRMDATNGNTAQGSLSPQIIYVDGAISDRRSKSIMMSSEPKYM